MNLFFCKYWWAAQLTAANYTVLFMDNDAVTLKDPFDHFEPLHYDLEGLTDRVNTLTDNQENPSVQVSY